MDDLSDMARLIEALRPWLDDLVIVGGWAHRLYRFHPCALPQGYQVVRTRDADLAFSLRARIEGDISEALEKAGFRRELSSEHDPPISQYRLGDDNEGFYAEFLTPLQGGDTRRDGTPDATVKKAGVTAQKLRHLDLLLVNPWIVNLGADAQFPLKQAAVLRVPSPVSFIAQKLLIRSSRTPDKQAQDLLYIHDTLELFGGDLDVLKAEWMEEHRPHLSPKTLAALGRNLDEQSNAVDDIVRRAVRIPQDRSMSVQRVRAAYQYGLRRIYGEA